MIGYPLGVGEVSTRVLQGGHRGPAVLLIHGLSSRADRFRHNVDALATGRRVYAVDLPGHGFATKGASFDYSARGYAAWLDDLLDVLGLKDVSIVGTSFGGLVASRYAIERPWRVRSLVLMGAIGIVPIGMERRRKTIAWLPDMQRASIAARLRAGVIDPALVTEAWIEEEYRINNSPGAAAAFAKLADYYASTIDDDATVGGLAGISSMIPVHLVWGAEDVSVSSEYGRAAHREIPLSTLTLVPEAGHLPYLEKPDEVNRLLDRLT